MDPRICRIIYLCGMLTEKSKQLDCKAVGICAFNEVDLFDAAKNLSEELYEDIRAIERLAGTIATKWSAIHD